MEGMAASKTGKVRDWRLGIWFAMDVVNAEERIVKDSRTGKWTAFETRILKYSAVTQVGNTRFVS